MEILGARMSSISSIELILERALIFGVLMSFAVSAIYPSASLTDRIKEYDVDQ